MSSDKASRYVIFRFVPEGLWQFIGPVKDLEQARKRIVELNQTDQEHYLTQDTLLGLTVASTRTSDN